MSEQPFLRVRRDGAILLDGEEVGYVIKVEAGEAWMGIANWRAEVGTPGDPEAWPRYRAVYAKTRKSAVAGAVEGLEARP